MFSRIGKETMIRDLVFVGELKGNKGVESTFEKERKREAMGNKRSGGEDDDEDDNF